MEQLRLVKNSKKANLSMPMCVRVLEEHHERLMVLEALAGFPKPPKKPLPNPPVEDFDVELPPTPPPREDIVEEKVSVVLPPVEVAPVADSVETVEPVEEVIDTRNEEESAYLDELLNKLMQIQDEASLLESELSSIKQMEAEEEHIEDDMTSVSTECTEACRESLSDVPPHEMSKTECKNCIKARAKEHKKERRKAEKERAREVKKIKEKHKELLKMEQHDLIVRLKNMREGKEELFGTIDEGVKCRLASEVSALAAAYAESSV